MNAKQIYEALRERFGSEIILALNEQAIDPWIEIAPASVAEVARFLKEDEALKFDSLNNLCGVDYLETDAKLAKNFPYEPHVEVVYHLYSFPQRHRITLKVKLPRWKEGQPGQLPEVPSVSDVWRIADWHERETYDLMGIRFAGHPNMVRILCPDDWVGHPLRKDYEFPLEYHGIRGK